MTEPTVTIELDPQEALAPAVSAKAPTASEEIIAEALKGSTVTDAKGRVLHLRRPGPRAEYTLAAAVGPELAANQVWMGMARPLTFLHKIDNDPIFQFTSQMDIEALIDRLDHEGMNEVMAWYMVNVAFPAAQAMEDAEKQSRLKNS